MILSAIVAASDNDVIGNKGQIPWKLKADSDFVKQKTMGHALIMGSKTHDAIGQVLPGRPNVVISRDSNHKVADGAILVGSIDEALNLDAIKNDSQPFIFGGQKIYELSMPKLQRIYLTRVHTTVEGDAFFKYDLDEWQEIAKQSHQADADNQFDYDFITLEPKAHS